MERCKIYPNYWNYYYYDEGSLSIKLVRKIGNKEIYSSVLNFDFPEEAKSYFEEECGV